MSNSASLVPADDEDVELRERAEERGIAVGEIAKRIVAAVLGGLSQRA